VGVVRLPLGDGFDAEVPGDRHAGVDTAEVDWTRVWRTAYAIHQRITYRYDGPVRRLRQRLMVQPRERHGDQRRVSRSLSVVDAGAHRVRVTPDGFGNHIEDITVPYVEEQVTFISWSIVERSADHRPHLAAGALLHDRRLLEPTQLTALDGELRGLVEELRSTGLDGVELATAACATVFARMRYAHGVTTVRTTAAQALAGGAGVCQDFAHILLAVTRGLGLASRYVSGQLLGCGGSHAWVEVLVPDGAGHASVLALDPTHGRQADMTHITIAIGRDYADVAPVSGTYVAPHAGVLTMSKHVSVMRIDHHLDDERLAG
jgi:transglutaminase-like putative cysteine protease